jgi:hypothetical protein
MIFCCLLVYMIHLTNVCGVLLAMFRNNDRKITGRKEKRLIPKQTRYSRKGHRATVTAELRKCLTLRNAIGVPCHNFLPSN